MPVFLVCIIVFLIWFRVKLKKSNAPDEESAAFWKREEEANFTRRQDISGLDYLTVSESDLPFTEQMDEREADLAAEVRERMQRKMLNLSGLTNTDLKEKYGFANLEELSNCDQNFMYFTRALSRWGEYLHEKGDTDRAKQIMEYAKGLGSDISAIYVTLGKIYAAEGNHAGLENLIKTVEDSSFPLKASILRQLKLCRLEY